MKYDQFGVTVRSAGPFQMPDDLPVPEPLFTRFIEHAMGLAFNARVHLAEQEGISVWDTVADVKPGPGNTLIIEARVVTPPGIVLVPRGET